MRVLFFAQQEMKVFKVLAWLRYNLLFYLINKMNGSSSALSSRWDVPMLILGQPGNTASTTKKKKNQICVGDVPTPWKWGGFMPEFSEYHKKELERMLKTMYGESGANGLNADVKKIKSALYGDEETHEPGLIADNRANFEKLQKLVRRILYALAALIAAFTADPVLIWNFLKGVLAPWGLEFNEA